MRQEQLEAKFGIIRPDEVAECWEGVGPELSRALWDCVGSYTAPSPEESEEPCYGMDCVADFWDRFTPEQQAELVRLEALNNPYGDVEQQAAVDYAVDHHHHRIGHD